MEKLIRDKRGQTSGLDLFQSILIALLILAFVGGFTYIAIDKFYDMDVVQKATTNGTHYFPDKNVTNYLDSMKENMNDTVDWLPLVILALILGAVLFAIFMAVRMWRNR